MVECDCSNDSWGCPKCISSDEECDCMEKCTCIGKYNCGEDIDKCTCINCSCGDMKCWICGKGEVPLGYDPCIYHGECNAKLEGCYNTTIEVVKENGTEKRIYIGPFEICDKIGSVCPHCCSHPHFEDIFINEMK